MERVRHTRATLGTISTWLPLSDQALCALDEAMRCLLPPPDLLDASLMGVCVAAEMARDGTIRLKVYVNGEIGAIGERYQRFINCLTAFDRPAAVARLRNLIGTAGDHVVPAFTAIDIARNGVGRLKLYFRPRDGTPALLALTANAVGCAGASALLDALHRSFLIGNAYRADAVDLSVEFPADDGEPGFKADLRTTNLFANDMEIDQRICGLLRSLSLPGADYRAARDIVVRVPRREGPPQIVFIGVACRREECAVDLYFHPLRKKAWCRDCRQ
jgi:hypothetical protein